jgi:hypothetical protein
MMASQPDSESRLRLATSLSGLSRLGADSESLTVARRGGESAARRRARRAARPRGRHRSAGAEPGRAAVDSDRVGGLGAWLGTGGAH